jgi:hypothetical protein
MNSYKKPPTMKQQEIELSEQHIRLGNLETKKLVIAHLVGLLGSGKISVPNNTSVAKHLVQEAEVIYNFLKYEPSSIKLIN